MSSDLNHFRKCFQPRDWFADEIEPYLPFINAEDILMWVYVEKVNDRGEQVFVVGFFLPDRSWQADSSFATRDEAAQRVNFLMGGRR